MVGYTQPVQKRNLPADHPSRYANLAIYDNGQIIGYNKNPDYVPLFTCTKYPEKVFDDVFCDFKGDKGFGACEDCPYLITRFGNAIAVSEEPYCVHEQLIKYEDSKCNLYNCRVCFEECLDCEEFEPLPGKNQAKRVYIKQEPEKPVEPLTDLDILDIIGETGLEIS